MSQLPPRKRRVKATSKTGKAKKPQKSESPYGVAFFVRMGVLLFLLLVVGGLFAYDRFVLVPGGEAAVERVVSEFADGGDRASIKKAAGRKPNSTETIGGFEVDHWHFGRILPTMTGYKVSVVYQDGRPTDALRGGVSEESRETFLKFSPGVRPKDTGSDTN